MNEKFCEECGLVLIPINKSICNDCQAGLEEEEYFNSNQEYNVTKPIVKQTHKIMVGRLKNKNVFIQVKNNSIEIEPDMINDLISSLLMVKE